MNIQQAAQVLYGNKSTTADELEQARKVIRESVGQIVKGVRAGTFVILGFRTIGGEQYAQLKEVNPDDHSQTARGEIALPLDAIKPL